MSDDTRQARIEAAMDAYRQWCDEHPVLPVFDVTRMYERHAGAMIAALDAADAAAPAVGVSDDRNPIDILFEFGSVYHRWIERAVTADDLNAAVRNALERIGATETLARMTAQPEPGTEGEQR